MRRVDLRPKNKRTVDNKLVWYVHKGKVYQSLIEIPHYLESDEIVLAVTEASFEGSMYQWRTFVRDSIKDNPKSKKGKAA